MPPDLGDDCSLLGLVLDENVGVTDNAGHLQQQAGQSRSQCGKRNEREDGQQSDRCLTQQNQGKRYQEKLCRAAEAGGKSGGSIFSTQEMGNDHPSARGEHPSGQREEWRLANFATPPALRYQPMLRGGIFCARDDGDRRVSRFVSSGRAEIEPGAGELESRVLV